MKKMIVAALALSLVPGGVAVAQERPLVNPNIERRLQELVNEKFANAILMTEKECESLGPGWRAYRQIAGRFPLAAGVGRDDRNERKKFDPGDDGGEYQHVLSVPEMPKHKHGYVDHRYGGRPHKVDHGDDRAHELQKLPRETDVRGGGEPHNNMPPYLVLRFCHKP